MSTTFESPTKYDNNNMLSPNNNSNSNSKNTTPIKNIKDINHDGFKDFMNAIQSRQLNWSTQTAPSIYRHRQIEDLAPMECQLLSELMTKYSEQQILIVDVRSFAYYSKSRIQSAIHLSIPSVLLKRASYTLDKVCDSISIPEAAERLRHWQQVTHVVFYDHSAYKPTDSGNSATAILLGSKLRKEGYKGQLNHLQGGFQSFSQRYADQCDFESMEELSTSIKRENRPTSIALPTSKDLDPNPFFSNIRQNLELAHGPIQERFDIRLPYGFHHQDGIVYCSRSPSSQTSGGSVQANTHYHPRFGLAGSSVDHEGNFELPVWLQKVMYAAHGPKLLADMYEQLERTEQKRLSTILQYHSNREQEPKSKFPLSITSSIEKGTLNRYDNIWPYEYSRVKLNEHDYINANYVQFANIKKDITQGPMLQSSQEASLQENGLLSQASVQTMNPSDQVDLVTTRPYISTQGPLPTTFHDFWKMIWDHQSFVIVMLTQEIEMNKMKCHRYWPSLHTSETYGLFTVSLVSESKQAVINMNDKREPIHGDDDEWIMIRTLRLRHNPTGQERTLSHLQYTGWTDFGVPDHPIGILQLVHEADEAYTRHKQTGPMVVHCSAGCGRSGTFCVIDTMIQRLWHERDVYTCSKQDKIWETVDRFREQRMSMVQTHRQFVFCYEAILWWLLGYGNLPTSPNDSDLMLMVRNSASYSPVHNQVLSPLNNQSYFNSNSTNADKSPNSVGSVVDDFEKM
ncbi:protein-tyrosine phosphatase-like protein [Gilbertella persicaria]|uniref:protein-tyrosine phosphatase-like protein n=1 Tax=Gilbertella persicaria TaxID=101096 RepID=UPI0022210B66|nr:protein-tyrosine phosphatase-like protein [Gilbertella persicaria]KAI8079679.1 protein-tyrosine phosphatase-like protein [Gilbertella persicaria]